MSKGESNDSITLIGLTGRAGAGKDTAAIYLEERYGFRSLSFAEPLREMACLLVEHIGQDYTMVTEPTLKNQPIPGLGFSARQFMQRVGTEAVRALNANAWVAALEMHAGLGEGAAPVHDRLVITDVRFPNEAAWLALQGGTLLRLVRPSAAPVAEHESERYVDALEAFEVDNGGTLHQLHSRLDCVCMALDIEPRQWGLLL